MEIKHKDTGDVLLDIDGDSLRGADLREYDLVGADMSDLDLCGALFQGTDLTDAELMGLICKVRI